MIRIVAIAVLVAGAARAQVPGWNRAGNNPKAFSPAVDREIFHSGEAAARVDCEKGCSGFGTLMQTVRANRYVGSRVRFSAWVKATKGSAPALWMRVDGTGGEMLAFDNMDGRAKKGPFEWTYQEIVLDVIEGAALVNFGVIARGQGTVWIDDVVLEQVPNVVRTTKPLRPIVAAPPGSGQLIEKAYYRSKLEPVNLDFEAREP
jgi:hypothetical protein